VYKLIKELVNLLLGCLQVVFIVLKLVGVVNWSWVWVLSPFWIPVFGVVFVLVFYLVVFVFFWNVWRIYGQTINCS
jgi:hypothetical protein